MKILKIGADWCSSCLVMRPRWQKIEQQFPNLKTQYYDFDQDKDIIEKYQIQDTRLPVFIFLDKKGQEILRLNGEIPKDKLIELIKQHQDQ